MQKKNSDLKQARINYVKQILGDKYNNLPSNTPAQAFAPSNIALVKYWGKKDLILNEPTNDSLSISLNNLGATTSIEVLNNNICDNICDNICHDKIILNNKTLNPKDKFCTRLSDFLDLFRLNSQNSQNSNIYFKINTKLNIPMGCGVASSACGFAAITLALDKLFNWQLPKTSLSKIARLGSGSAARSLWQGFVHWKTNGEAMPLTNLKWPKLCIGLCVLTNKPKSIGSTEAMLRTQKTAPNYHKWPEYAQSLIKPIINSIEKKDFKTFGEISEECAITMHELMHASTPSINYDLTETIELKKLIHNLRNSGIPIYFTQDAGPNIKVLFEKDNLKEIKKYINNMQIIENINQTKQDVL